MFSTWELLIDQIIFNSPWNLSQFQPNVCSQSTDLSATWFLFMNAIGVCLIWRRQITVRCGLGDMISYFIAMAQHLRQSGQDMCTSLCVMLPSLIAGVKDSGIICISIQVTRRDINTNKPIITSHWTSIVLTSILPSWTLKPFILRWDTNQVKRNLGVAYAGA